MTETPVQPREPLRWDLVVVDFAFMLVGIGGAIGSVPALEEILPPWMVDLLCYALITLGAVALVGVVIPKLWPLEMIAKLFIGGGLIAYELTLLILVFAEFGDDVGGGRLYVVGGVIIPIAVVIKRFPDLINKWAKETALKKQKRQAARDAAAMVSDR
ncbi:hypothetical protein ASF48_04895 [Rathayibacter sp. Leaf299]|uniref:hypothetical protein n=1 Tax=Rathayibacter sp. Leaf299 TaxID=1736328 RepID=UPI0006F4E25B|nr:hypothetical protein [Rathayibacter sp. Leaf299]KQQ22523.1 hypothetical protein ASF48_04895 [Rathayibacter sp. Leaf299]